MAASEANIAAPLPGFAADDQDFPWLWDRHSHAQRVEILLTVRDLRVTVRRQKIRSEPPPPHSHHSLPCLRGTLHKPQPSALSPQPLLLHA